MKNMNTNQKSSDVFENWDYIKDNYESIKDEYGSIENYVKHRNNPEIQKNYDTIINTYGTLENYIEHNDTLFYTLEGHYDNKNIEESHVETVKSEVNKIVDLKEVRVDNASYNVEKARQNPNVKIHLRNDVYVDWAYVDQNYPDLIKRYSNGENHNELNLEVAERLIFDHGFYCEYVEGYYKNEVFYRSMDRLTKFYSDCDIVWSENGNSYYIVRKKHTETKENLDDLYSRLKSLEKEALEDFKDGCPNYPTILPELFAVRDEIEKIKKKEENGAGNPGIENNEGDEENNGEGTPENDGGNNPNGAGNPGIENNQGDEENNGEGTPENDGGNNPNGEGNPGIKNNEGDEENNGEGTPENDLPGVNNPELNPNNNPKNNPENFVEEIKITGVISDTETVYKDEFLKNAEERLRSHQKFDKERTGLGKVKGLFSRSYRFINRKKILNKYLKEEFSRSNEETFVLNNSISFERKGAIATARYELEKEKYGNKEIRSFDRFSKDEVNELAKQYVNGEINRKSFLTRFNDIISKDKSIKKSLDFIKYKSSDILFKLDTQKEQLSGKKVKKVSLDIDILNGGKAALQTQTEKRIHVDELNDKIINSKITIFGSTLGVVGASILAGPVGSLIAGSSIFGSLAGRRRYNDYTKEHEGFEKRIVNREDKSTPFYEKLKTTKTTVKLLKLSIKGCSDKDYSKLTDIEKIELEEIDKLSDGVKKRRKFFLGRKLKKLEKKNKLYSKTGVKNIYSEIKSELKSIDDKYYMTNKFKKAILKRKKNKLKKIKKELEKKAELNTKNNFEVKKGTTHRHFAPIDRLNAKIEKYLNISDLSDKQFKYLTDWLSQALARIDLYEEKGYNFLKASLQDENKSESKEADLYELKKNIVLTCEKFGFTLEDLKEAEEYNKVLNLLNEDLSSANDEFKKVRNNTALKQGIKTASIYAASNVVFQFLGGTGLFQSAEVINSTNVVVNDPSLKELLPTDKEAYLAWIKDETNVQDLISKGYGVVGDNIVKITTEIDPSIVQGLKDVMSPEQLDLFISNLQNAEGPATLWDLLVKDIFNNKALGTDAKNKIMEFILNAQAIASDGLPYPELFSFAKENGVLNDLTNNPKRIEKIVKLMHKWGYKDVDFNFIKESLSAIDKDPSVLSSFGVEKRKRISEVLFCYIRNTETNVVKQMYEIFVDEVSSGNLVDFETITSTIKSKDSILGYIGLPIFKNTFLSALINANHLERREEKLALQKENKEERSRIIEKVAQEKAEKKKNEVEEEKGPKKGSEILRKLRKNKFIKKEETISEEIETVEQKEETTSEEATSEEVKTEIIETAEIVEEINIVKEEIENDDVSEEYLEKLLEGINYESEEAISEEVKSETISKKVKFKVKSILGKIKDFKLQKKDNTTEIPEDVLQIIDEDLSGEEK